MTRHFAASCRLVAFALFSLLPVASQAGGCVAKDPAGTVQWVFEHASQFYVHNEGSPRYLSPELYKLLKRDWKCQEPGELCAIEADPWTNAQDGSLLKPVTYRITAETAQSASVELSAVFGWEDQPQENKPTTVTLNLVRADAKKGCWLLDDIRHGKDSFKRQLSAYGYEAQ